MSRHSFGSELLQEISIIVILIFCLNLISSCLLSILDLVTIEKKCMGELTKSINTLIINLIKCDLARVKKRC